MSLADSARPGHGAPACRIASWLWRLDRRAVDFCFGLTIVALWVAGHGIVGFDADGSIYMGRVLADLDPNGVGRDTMFAFDGQSAFSVFRILARTIVAQVGLGTAIVLFGIVNVVFWFAAMLVFSRALVPGRHLALVMAAVCVLPRAYTPWHALGVGEAVAVPRPLAEAFVLLALAALGTGRLWLSAACLLVAVLFHPLMAAAGFGVLSVVLGLRDRRWLMLAGALAAAFVVAAVMGVPIASRLTAAIDPDWRSILVERNRYLFLHLWPFDAFGLIAVQCVTIGIAGLWLEPRWRTIFHVCALVALLGCLVSIILGDAFSLLLILQTQPWRALWLVAALAPVSAGICLVHLPSRGVAGQIALACLCTAWIVSDNAILAVSAAVAAVLVLAMAQRFQAVTRPVVLTVWGVCLFLIVSSYAPSLQVLATAIARMPPGVDKAWTTAWSLQLFLAPVMGAAYVVWRWPNRLAVRLGAPVFLCASAYLAVVDWDTRPSGRRDADAAVIKPDLVILLARRPGEVLWLEGDEVWAWARRPSWVSQTQGAGLVFSRDQAFRWKARADAVVENGLATGYLLNPWQAPHPLDFRTLSQALVDRFCRAGDAPAWIVAPLDPESPVPAVAGVAIWEAPAGHWKLMVGPGDVRWHRVARYAVVPCAASG